MNDNSMSTADRIFFSKKAPSVRGEHQINTIKMAEQNAAESAGVSPAATIRSNSFHPVASVSEDAAPALFPADWSYQNKKILAPMVRVGLLPFRLLCAQVRHS
jgi:hypothetical protein